MGCQAPIAARPGGTKAKGPPGSGPSTLLLSTFYPLSVEPPRHTDLGTVKPLRTPRTIPRDLLRILRLLDDRIPERLEKPRRHGQRHQMMHAPAGGEPLHAPHQLSTDPRPMRARDDRDRADFRNGRRVLTDRRTPQKPAGLVGRNDEIVERQRHHIG